MNLIEVFVPLDLVVDLKFIFFNLIIKGYDVFIIQFLLLFSSDCTLSHINGVGNCLRLNDRSILHYIIFNFVNKIKRIETKTKIDKINNLFPCILFKRRANLYFNSLILIFYIFSLLFLYFFCLFTNFIFLCFSP